ncbi:hypothetical protein [Cupriavidus pampae]|uniref:Uncharacterized protein n=1 Tax=Cupriavidus pampae TaxID=659251 RepID=A0ABM8XZK4_9BURK|nr:hypothetical protein [Cupriavidus pampae]CAG9185884.1 hypothetical protein LMG32289_06143 [Cupriavidus pampae]
MTFTTSNAATAPRIISALEVQSAEAADARRANRNNMVDYAGIYQRVANNGVDIMVGGHQQDFEAVRSNPKMNDTEKGLEIVRQLTEKLIGAGSIERKEALAVKVVEAITAPDVMDADIGAITRASSSYDFDTPARQSLNISTEKDGIVSLHKSSEWDTCRAKAADSEGNHAVFNGKPVLKTDMRFEISPAGVSTQNGPMLRMDLMHWHHSGDATVPVARELSTPAQERTFLQWLKDVLSDFCGRAGIRFETGTLKRGQAVALAESRGDVGASKVRGGRDGQDHFTSANSGAFHAKKLLPGQQLASMARPQAWKAEALTQEINKIDRTIAGLTERKVLLLKSRDNLTQQIQEIRRGIAAHPENADVVSAIRRGERGQRTAINTAYAQLRQRGEIDFRDALRNGNEKIRELESVVRDGIADDDDEAQLNDLLNGREALQQAADAQHARVLDQLLGNVAVDQTENHLQQAYCDATKAQAIAKQQLELIEFSDAHLQYAIKAKEGISEKLSECDTELNFLNSNIKSLINSRNKYSFQEPNTIWPRTICAEPTSIKPHEIEKNRFRVDLPSLVRGRHEKFTLKNILDENLRYIWVAKPNPETGAIDISIGYEYKDDLGRRYGHPTLTLERNDPTKAGSAYIGGEIYAKNGVWFIDNDSGRFGQGNILERNKIRLGKRHMLQKICDQISNSTDLKFNVGITYSKHSLKRSIQHIWYGK